MSRIGLLLVVLAMATQLNRWSREGHPRFFQFIDTPAGRVIANTFGAWRPSSERPPVIKPRFLMNSAEREVQLEIEQAVQDRIRLTHPHIEESPYRITHRDVRFRMELQGLNMVVIPPYLVMTDARPQDVEPTVEELKSLRSEITKEFAPLFTRSPGKELIHVAYFEKRRSYDAYQSLHAEAMIQTSGYYNPTVNMLVLSNQSGYNDLGQETDQTIATARHEATHQIFFTYGVHSDHRIENEWLIEGLASYCESGPFGSIAASQVRLFKSAALDHQLIEIDDLVNHRSEKGLLAYKPTQLAYSQSQLLVHFLMAEENRGGFFKYVEYIRDPANFRQVRDANRFQLLAEILDLRPSELQTRWREYAAAL
jgi:hypothetical protein